MTKATLVIDIPNEYKDKDLVIVGEYLWLGYIDGHCLKEIEDLDTEILHFKELPKPIQIPSDLPAYAHYTKGYDDGWNACIEEIAGEEMTDKEFRYIVIEGYTDGIWYVIDTFENDKVIREFKDQRPLAYDYCEKLNRKVVKTI